MLTYSGGFAITAAITDRRTQIVRAMHSLAMSVSVMTREDIACEEGS
jgi:hypothetical protein